MAVMVAVFSEMADRVACLSVHNATTPAFVFMRMAAMVASSSAMAAAMVASFSRPFSAMAPRKNQLVLLHCTNPNAQIIVSNTL